MMCLESDGSSGSSPGCGGRLRAGDEEEEEDGERGCCGRGAEGEVQTLSGRMNPPAAGKHPDRPAALRKAPSLGRARVAAAGILSVGNVLNYLDRYTVAGERTRGCEGIPRRPATALPGHGTAAAVPRVVPGWGHRGSPAVPGLEEGWREGCGAAGAHCAALPVLFSSLSEFCRK